jgi:hypothetical protein
MPYKTSAIRSVADQGDTDNKKTGGHIALCASYGLGDGLLFLIIANNLHQNGFSVTFYSDFVSQLKDWLPYIGTKPFPVNQRSIETSFRGYDLTIADGVSVVGNAYRLSTCPEAFKHCIFIGMSRFGQDLANKKFCISRKIQNQANAQAFIAMSRCSGTVLSRLNPRNTMVDNIATFCRDMMHLKNVNRSNGLIPPANLTYQKYRNRVIIHPESTKEAKNWLPSQFLKLSWYLKRQGWFPIFIVSPKERAEWKSRVRMAFPMPLFNSLSELASYIYESGIMIGTDSGIGHLASSLGIPTITIHRKRDPHYRWRPGWHTGKIVTPLVSITIKRKCYWRRALPVQKVISAIKSLNKQIDREQVGAQLTRCQQSSTRRNRFWAR